MVKNTGSSEALVTIAFLDGYSLSAGEIGVILWGTQVEHMKFQGHTHMENIYKNIKKNYTTCTNSLFHMYMNFCFTIFFQRKKNKINK